MNITPHRLKEVYEARDNKRTTLFTKSLIPGPQPFADQQIVRQDGAGVPRMESAQKQTRSGDRQRITTNGPAPGAVVLYLGASHGLTPSHVSDIVGPDGFVFCLDVAPRVVRDLVFVCEARENMAPLLNDAKQPGTYADKLPREGVDAVYQDIAQKEQVTIFLKNCDAFLKRGGYGLLAVKARASTSPKPPRTSSGRLSGSSSRANPPRGTSSWTIGSSILSRKTTRSSSSKNGNHDRQSNLRPGAAPRELGSGAHPLPDEPQVPGACRVRPRMAAASTRKAPGPGGHQAVAFPPAGEE